MNATRLGGLLAPATCNTRQLKFVAGITVCPLPSGLSAGSREYLPDDASWTGFQNHDPSAGTGYLMVFRELRATEYRKAPHLRFVAGFPVPPLRSGLSGTPSNVAK